MTRKRTLNFGDFIRAKLAADPELAKAVEDESFNADIAQQVFDLRNEAGLTQRELAERIQTQQSVISRIEDADYDGHSLALLKKIASALNRKLKVDFCAQPLPFKGAVTEFALQWSESQEWHMTMGGVKQMDIRAAGLGTACGEDINMMTTPLESILKGRPNLLSEIADE